MPKLTLPVPEHPPSFVEGMDELAGEGRGVPDDVSRTGSDAARPIRWHDPDAFVEYVVGLRPD